MCADSVEITCLCCKYKRSLPIGAATQMLCQKCQGSSAMLSSDNPRNHYNLECLKCHKVFGVGSGVKFDVREFDHCRMHIYKFTLSTQGSRFIKKKIDINNSDLQADITSNYLSESKYVRPEKPSIALITVPNEELRQYKYWPYLSQKLREKYTVYQFNLERISKENLATIYQCDLAIGGVNDLSRYAISYQIPTITIHTEMVINTRGTISVMGISSINPDKILDQAESILSIPNLSYCIVTHNRYEKLAKCINAILDYRRVNEEIVLVDNNSNDKTKDYLKELKSERNVKIKYVRKNHGCVIGRNISMKIATGRHLMILDDDQIISADTLYKMRQVDADIVGTECWQMLGTCLPSKVEHTNQDIAYIGAGGMLLPNRIAQELNYFDEIYAPGYYEDPDFCYRAKKAGYKIAGCKNNIQHLGPGMDQSLGEDAAKIKNRNKEIFRDRWKNSQAHRDKPSVIMIVDVPGWAWDIKTKNIIKYLKDDFDITIKYLAQIPSYVKEDYSIYFCYDFPFIRLFRGKPKHRIIGGVTAHTYTNFDEYKAKLQSCGAVHANSMLLYNEVTKLNSNTFYVPNGVDENHFTFHPRKQAAFQAGYVGKSHDRKGYNNFIVPACQKAKVKLKAQTTKYNTPSVITPYEMPAFYHDVDCIIIASDMDGTPNQMLEAAATGRTFVGVPIGNVPEFHNEKNGFIVKRDVNEISEKLVWLKDHRKECAEMGIEARKTVEQEWTWEHQAENYKNMFYQVLKK